MLVWWMENWLAMEMVEQRWTENLKATQKAVN